MRDFLSERPFLLGKKQLIHISCWGILIFLEVVVVGVLKQQFSSLAYYILFYSLNIALFYFHGMFVMTLSTKTGFVGITWFLLFIIIEFFIYFIGAIGATIILRYIFNEYSTTPSKFDFNFFIVVLYRALIFIAYATGYYYLNVYLNRREREMNQALQFEKVRNQLLTVQKDYLRAQINPHLFFNTLDFIKAVSKTNPEQSDEAIDCLSDIMDYALDTSHQDLVDIEREIEQIEHMIRLNSLRSNNRLNLDFRKSLDSRSVKIIPIILLTLFENIFKHGNLLDRDCPAIVTLNINNKEILFKTQNLIASTPTSRSTGTGLNNVKARLSHAYPDKYKFECFKNKNVFYTELKILL